MGRQGTLYCWKGFLALALSSLAASSGVARDLVTPATEPEASPLFARSLQGAFADMAARDHGLGRARESSNRPATGSGTVVLVEGTQWYNGSAKGRAGLLSAGPIRRLGYTTEVSCVTPTTCYITFLPTYCGGVTCSQTCDPGPTCLYQTCNGEATCTANQPTCVGTTCYPAPSCVVATCAPSPTCQGTCAPASCPTALTAVSVPQAGQIQLSFISSAQLSYVLQYCTNLSARGWVEAFSTNGNGGPITLVHTNGAMMSLYRLLIQNL